MSKDDELVLGIPRSDLFSSICPPFNGYLSSALESISLIRELDRKPPQFRRRGDCEKDSSFKQIIPYCIISRCGEIFAYQRKSAGAEKRLHAKMSIGIGGHVNPSGSNSAASIISDSVRREFEEEVILKGCIFDQIPCFLNGLINWDKDEVGKVHLGLVYRYFLPPEADIQVRETEQLEGRFYPRGRLLDFDNWESWSKLIIEGNFSATGMN